VLGLGIAYDLEEYFFSGSSDLTAPAPGYDPPDRGQPFVSPLLLARLAASRRPYHRGCGGRWGGPGDALVYGAVVSATKTVGRDLSIGFGAGAFRQIDRWRVFPFLSIAWRINDRWRLSNPLRVGPAGPRGWNWCTHRRELGGGRGGCLSLVPVPAGRGRQRPGRDRGDPGIPLFARSPIVAEGWRANLYAGVVLGGRLALENGQGDGIASTSFDPAPLAGCSSRGDSEPEPGQESSRDRPVTRRVIWLVPV